MGTPDVSAHALVQSSLVGEALDDGPALVFVADEEQRYVAVNRHACAVLGYDRDELLGLRVTDVAVDDSATTLYDDLVRTRRGRGIVHLRGKDGRTVAFDYRASETRLAGLTYYVAVGFADEPAAQGTAAGNAAGSTIANVDPSPSRDSTVSSPPMRSTSSREM